MSTGKALQRRCSLVRFDSRIAGMAPLLALVVLSCSCAGHGRIISAEMTTANYARFQLQGRSGEVRIRYPWLEVYDRAGFVIYRGGIDSDENVKMLDSLPQALAAMKRIGSAPTLKEELEKVPAFKAQESAIISSKHYVLISVGLAACLSCATQDKAIERLRGRVDRTRFDILTLTMKQQ